MGLAGGLYVGFIGYVSPFDFKPILTFQIWTMLIVGGSANNRGALLGAVLVWAIWTTSGFIISKVVPPAMMAQSGALQAVLIGVVLVAMLLFRPRGPHRRGGARLAARPALSGPVRPATTFGGWNSEAVVTCTAEGGVRPAHWERGQGSPQDAGRSLEAGRSLRAKTPAETVTGFSPRSRHATMGGYLNLRARSKSMDNLRNGLAVAAATAFLAVAGSGPAAADDCTIKLGVVLPVSGPMGLVGERIADTGQFAVDVFNERGRGQGLQGRVRASRHPGPVDGGRRRGQEPGGHRGGFGPRRGDLERGQPPHPDLRRGSLQGHPDLVLLVFHQLHRARRGGQDRGYWFRTYATNRSQSAMGGLLTANKGYQKTAVIYVNTDFGVGLAKQFEKDLPKLGGTITKMVAYNEEQQSYRAR